MSFDSIVRLVLYKRYSKEKSGIVKIQIYDRITKSQKHISTKVKIYEKDWDKKLSRVKPTNDNYIELNNRIEQALKTFKHNNDSSLKLAMSDPTFNAYFDKFISAYSSFGSIKKYGTIKNHFLGFINDTYHKTDIRLYDITPQVINKFRTYMLQNGLANSTINRNLKNFKTLLNKARKDRYFNPPIDPFIDITLKNPSTKKDFMTEDEVWRIINKPDEELSEALFLTKNMALMSIFAQGTRVSDILLLRFHHVKDDGFLRFIMRKTKKPIQINVNGMVQEQLVKALRYHNIQDSVFESRLEDYYEEKALYQKEIINAKMGSENDSISEEYEFALSTQSRNVRRAFAKLFLEVNKHISENFVFPLLSEEHFPTDNREYFSKYQFNQLGSKSAIYNKRLKRLAKTCDITKSVSSHMMRHTYSNLVLSHDNANLYEISKSLGHSSIKETESYLRSFDSEKVKTLSENLSSQFNR